jgi:hypothetical protein
MGFIIAHVGFTNLEVGSNHCHGECFRLELNRDGPPSSPFPANPSTFASESLAQPGRGSGWGSRQGARARTICAGRGEANPPAKLPIRGLLYQMSRGVKRLFLCG